MKNLLSSACCLFFFFIFILAVAAAFALPAAAAAAKWGAYLPETSGRTLDVSPLERGETAFEDAGDGTARLYVGGDAGRRLEVRCPSSPRGCRVEELPRSRCAIVPGPGVTRIDAEDRYMAGATSGEVYTVAVECPPEMRIASVDYARHEGGGLLPDKGAISHAIDGSRAVISMLRISGSGTLSVAHIRVYVATLGDPDAVNDLDDIDYWMRDALGDWNLSGLRKWTIGLTDGNRGEDWSHFAAREAVRLAGQQVTFDPRGRYRLGIAGGAESNLVVRVDGMEAVTVGVDAPELEGSLVITNITTGMCAGTATNCVICYTNSIPDFDESRLVVLCSPTLDSSQGGWWGNYTVVPDEAVTARADGMIAVDPRRIHDLAAGRVGFFRLRYGSSASGAVRITIRGTVTFAADAYAARDGGGYVRLNDALTDEADPVFEAWTNSSSVAAGKSSSATGTGVAIGQGAGCAVNSGAAVGAGARVTGANGVAVGGSSQAAGPYSAALGPSAKTGSAAMMSVQLGNGTCASSFTLQFFGAPLGAVDGFSQSTFTVDSAVKIPQVAAAATAATNYTDSVLGPISTALDAILGGH